jgi:hypothetical protein
MSGAVCTGALGPAASTSVTASPFTAPAGVSLFTAAPVITALIDRAFPKVENNASEGDQHRRR